LPNFRLSIPQGGGQDRNSFGKLALKNGALFQLLKSMDAQRSRHGLARYGFQKLGNDRASLCRNSGQRDGSREPNEFVPVAQTGGESGDRVWRQIRNSPNPGVGGIAQPPVRISLIPDEQRGQRASPSDKSSNANRTKSHIGNFSFDDTAEGTNV
jgi:hypothetical protein